MSNNKTKSFAIILASGSGSRFNSNSCPKHLIDIKGVPTIVWTLNLILQSGVFEGIIIVARDSDLLITNKLISKFFNIEKEVFLTTAGGKDRMQSFFNGLSEISRINKINNSDLIALIDSNRPFCSADQMVDLNKLARINGCSCPARPVVNGVAKVFSKKITEVPPKEDFVEFVTPEFIRYELLKQSIDKSSTTAFKSLVEHSLNVFVQSVFTESSELNSKLTYPEDLVFLEGLVSKYNLKIPVEIKIES